SPRPLTPLTSFTSVALAVLLSASFAAPAPAQIFDFAYSPNGTGGSFGASLSRIGDVDNDGCEDFVAGEPGFAIPNGLARVFSGKTHALIVDIAGNIGSGLGASVDGKIDLDNDGFPDVLLGAPNDSTGASNAGAVLAFSPHKNAQIWFVSSTVSTAQF